MKTKYKIIAFLLALLAVCAYVGVNAQTTYLGSTKGKVQVRANLQVDSTLTLNYRMKLGTSTGTGLINLPDSTNAANGIAFGTNISLYRTASETIRLNSTTFELYSPTNSRVSLWAAAGGRLRLINNVGGGVTFFDFDSGAGSSIIDYTSNSLVLKSSGSTRFEISSSGGQVNITPPTLTGSSSTSALSITQTWNTTGSPRGMLLNFTNTASGTTARPFEIQISSSPVMFIDKAGAITTTKFCLSALNTAPSSASDTGTLGEVRITATYIYVCTAANTWVRSALATW